MRSWRREPTAATGGDVKSRLFEVKISRTLRYEVVGRSRGQRLNSQSRVSRALRWQDAAVTHEEVWDVVGAPETVDYRGARVPTHPRATDQVRITRLLDHLRAQPLALFPSPCLCQIQ